MHARRARGRARRGAMHGYATRMDARIILLQAFLGKSPGAQVEARWHSMVGDFDPISSQDANILYA